MKDDPTTLQARYDALLEELANERANTAGLVGGIDVAARTLRMACYTLWAMAPEDSWMRKECHAVHESATTLVRFLDAQIGILQEKLSADVQQQTEDEPCQILH
jgi:hypothetical protein